MSGFNVAVIATLLKDMVMSALAQRAPSYEMFSTTADMGICAPGEKAQGIIYSNATDAAEFDASSNNYGTSTAPDADSISLTFGQPIKLTKKLQPIHYAQGLALQELINGMVANVVNQHQKLKIWPLITAANFGTAVHDGADTTMTAKKFGTFQAVTAANLGWLTFKAGLVSAYYDALSGDSDLKTHTPKEDEQLESGRIRTISGWDIFNIPGLTDNSERLKGFITDRSGIVVVTAQNRLTEGVAKLCSYYEAVRDPRTGITLTIHMHSDASANADFLTVELLAAQGKGRGDGLKRITIPST